MQIRPAIPGMCATVLACFALASSAGEPPKVLSFPAEARVEVDTDGKLVKVEASQDLPEAVRRYIEQQVATWKFVPRHRDGETGNSSTWVSLGACAVPAANGYSMGLAFNGNGPRIAGGGPWPPVTSDIFVLVAKNHLDGRADVHFVVNADGTVKVTSMESATDRRELKMLERPVRRWMEGLRFDPEEIGGRPVATRQTVPLVFTSVGGRTVPDSLRPNVLQSPQCRMAAMAGQAVERGMRAAAVDSVVDIVPSI